MNGDPFDLGAEEPEAGPPAPGAPAAPATYLDALNPEQRRAVETTEGPVLVLSGAGTGKTRVLTTRLAHILAQRLARPHECLAVTFTNKAAREMRHRVAELVGGMAEGVWLGTFHALGARILRRHAEQAGLGDAFTILDDDDQKRLVKQLLEAENVDTKRWPVRNVLGAIQRWKDRALGPDGVPDDEAEGWLVRLYRQYQERLRTLNAVDFGDLLLLPVHLFQQDPDIAAEYQRRFRYILVDEYQDTNVAQYLWLRLLATGHHNLCCVGDDDQAIYSWRGAEVANILRFEHDYPDAAVIRLERNYRSTDRILEAASHLIAHNDSRMGKRLHAETGATGPGIQVRAVWDGEAEARVIGDLIEEERRAGRSLEEMAVLVRAGLQTREIEERLIVLGTPYRVLGGPRFYERQEIRDALAYLRVINQPADDLAFERIVNVPKRGLGAAALRTLHQVARAQDVPLAEAARRAVETDELKPKARKALGDLMAAFERWRERLAYEDHTEVVKAVLDESGYTEMWQNTTTPDARTRLDNLKELVAAVGEFDSLAAFLEHVALVMENETDAPGERVSLMTLHGAKGLEFPVVFLPGWEEGLFPHQRAMDENGLKGLEEERRLAYVGLTRAQERVYISHAASRRMYNQWQQSIPSRFIEELPDDHVQYAGDHGVPAPGLQETHEPFEGTPVFGPAWRDGAGFSPGDAVVHEKFGRGRVESVDGNKLQVVFDRAGRKRVMDSFVAAAPE